MSSHSCQLCGGGIVFRTIHGRCVPLHIGETSCPGSTGRKDREPQEGLIATKCPRCKQQVFFLRHNGGSVWLDEIPWPWPKHSCFQEEAEELPPDWLSPQEVGSPSKLVRLRACGRNRASIHPVTPRDKKFFNHLGNVDIQSDDDPTLNHFDNRLALVSANTPISSRRPTFQALCTNGFRYRLSNPS